MFAALGEPPVLVVSPIGIYRWRLDGCVGDEGLSN